MPFKCVLAYEYLILSGLATKPSTIYQTYLIAKEIYQDHQIGKSSDFYLVLPNLIEQGLVIKGGELTKSIGLSRQSTVDIYGLTAKGKAVLGCYQQIHHTLKLA